MISILCPTLGRASRLPWVVANALGQTADESEVVLIAERDDEPTLDMARSLAAQNPAVILVINDRARSWSGAINAAYPHARGQYIFTGSDDLRFSKGWDTPALQLLGSNQQLRVSGTNDLGNPTVTSGQTSTSHLVDRRYIDEVGGVVDQPPGIMQYEGYDHNYTDQEFVETARHRGVFSVCLESVVEHMHPVFGKSPWDETYKLSIAHYEEDQAVFNSRRHLWERAS